MKHPPLVIVAVLLLLAIHQLAMQPLTKTLALCALVAIPLITFGLFLARRAHVDIFARRRGMWLRPAWVTTLLTLLAGLIVVIAYGAMQVTQPTLRTSYTPDQFASASAITDRRGFYPTEVDTAGNRYAWTQERATLVFDFLVRRPITLTFDMRSAAVAGGPAGPVQVIVNGQEAGMLTPDPKNANFQPLGLRVTPFDWGGERTEVRLVPQTFHPARGDNRLLGTMIQRVTIDKSEAWSPIGQRMWLIGLLPVCAALALILSLTARRYLSALAGYGAVAVCVVGAAVAMTIFALVFRIGFIAYDTYSVWIAGAVATGGCFAVACVLLPLGYQDGTSIMRVTRDWLIPHCITMRMRRATASLLRPSADPAPVTRRRIARDLALLFAIALGIRLIWVFVIPPWQSPDEEEHFIYAKHIVEQGEIPHPPLPAQYPFYSPEDTTSWKYTLLSLLSPAVAGNAAQTIPYLPFSYDYETARTYQAQPEDRRTNGGGRATSYPPLYYLIAAIPYALFKDAPVLSRLYAVRSMSAMMGALSCVFAYLLAYEVRRTRQWGWALGLCMACMPMYVFMTASVNNDVAMDLFGTALIWLIARIYRQRAISPRFACVVGIVSALTLLTKPNVIPIVIVAGVVTLVVVASAMRKSWGQSRTGATTLGVYAASVVAVYGPYLLFRLRTFGDIGLSMAPVTNLVRFLTGMMNVRAASSETSSSLLFLSRAKISPWDYLLILKDRGWNSYHWLFVRTFWGDFGWLDAPIPERFYLVIVAALIIGGIGLLIQLFLQPRRRGILFLLLAVIAAQVGFIFLTEYYLSYVKANSALGLQGRYFFPILAPLLLLVLSGWDHLVREHPSALRLGVLAMFWLQMISLATMFARYYGVSIG